ncbi:MAG: DUF262 domain-containing protein [Rhodospirillales bacterium]|nr:DUF262 domain-containing protein [Rhodospirillales bacterium]
MELPQPTHRNYTTLISNIEEGEIKIPQFQRDFVWTLQRSAELLDSVVKGYPIGTFIFWLTRERLHSVRELGNAELPPAKEGETVSYVLDGQQRLTSLFAAMRGLPDVYVDRQSTDFSEIYIDLNAGKSDTIVTPNIEGRPEKTVIKLTALLYGDLETLTAFPKEYHKKIDEYKRRIQAYDFPIIEVRDTPIDIATEIFTRINVGGKSLTVFEIMVAKTYDEKRDFDLSVKYSELIECLDPIGYDTISDQTILQLIALILKKDCKRQTILKLEKDDFIETWQKAVYSVKGAVEYFRNVMRIPVSQLLPYLTLIVPFAYFFYHNDNKKPSSSQKAELDNFFWRCSLGDRYSSAVESKLAQDVNRIELIWNDKSPDYDWDVDISSKSLIENGSFNTGRAFIKAILCIMAYQGPLSFNNGADVNISNNWLQRANSKNYHHFFPRKFLENNGFSKDKANNVFNITIVDDYLNKRLIGTKPPSKYMETFKDDNPDLVETMKTHLIGDLDTFGIWEDDYETFIRERSKAISKKLKKRIIRH